MNNCVNLSRAWEKTELKMSNFHFDYAFLYSCTVPSDRRQQKNISRKERSFHASTPLVKSLNLSVIAKWTREISISGNHKVPQSRLFKPVRFSTWIPFQSVFKRSPFSGKNDRSFSRRVAPTSTKTTVPLPTRNFYQRGEKTSSTAATRTLYTTTTTTVEAVNWYRFILADALTIIRITRPDSWPDNEVIGDCSAPEIRIGGLKFAKSSSHAWQEICWAIARSYACSCCVMRTSVEENP